MRRRQLIALFVCALAAAGSATAREGVDVGQPSAMRKLVPAEGLERQAAQEFSQLKSQAATKKALAPDDHPQTRRLREIANRLIPHAARFNPRALQWQWEVILIDAPPVNAFCMPGGKIAFYSGLIRQLNLSDQEISVVMGHEISHALREHSREQVSHAIAAQTTIGIGAALLGLGGGSADLASTAYEALIATRFSRVDESEADRMGLELTARAGYDPRAGVTLWQKMMRAGGSGGRPPEFLSTHPAETNRIQQIESLLPTVMPLYEAARRRN